MQGNQFDRDSTFNDQSDFCPFDSSLVTLNAFYLEMGCFVQVSPGGWRAVSLTGIVLTWKCVESIIFSGFMGDVIMVVVAGELTLRLFQVLNNG